MKTVPEMSRLFSRRLASLLSTKPPLVCAFDTDFERNIDAFAAFGEVNPGLCVLLQLGFEHETPELASRLASTIAAFLGKSAASRVVVLANSLLERESLSRCGLDAREVHQNCFLDERRYMPYARASRPYDAAYIARLTPCKRHELVPPSLSPRLMLLGCSTKIYDSERGYADMVFSRYSGAKIVNTFSGARISEYLSLAKCGLVLSAREGASFCSSEYFLCGLPVVDTPAMGGRSVLYPERYVRYADSCEESVGEAIGFWKVNRPDPREVRSAWLEKALPHREAFRRLFEELAHRAARRRPPHKLGLRTPHPGALYSEAIRTYLALKGMFAR